MRLSACRKGPEGEGVVAISRGEPNIDLPRSLPDLSRAAPWRGASWGKWRVAGTVALCLLAVAPSAHANQPPGPMLMLSEILILPVMILLSLAGGAYAILDRKTAKRRRVRSWARGLLAVLAILLSGAQEGLGALVALIFGLIALGRAAQMLNWGARGQKLAAAELAEDGRRPRPARLMAAGAVLAAITLFLMGQAFAFVGYWPTYAGREKLQQFQRLVAHQLAYAERQESRTGIHQHRRMTGEELRQSSFYALANPSFRIDYGPEERSFTAYLAPGHFPFFPYNYLTSQPSYRADESGQIRMVQVHWQGALCPPDALVVMTIGQDEIKAARQRLEALEAVEAAPPDSGQGKPK